MAETPRVIPATEDNPLLGMRDSDGKITIVDQADVPTVVLDSPEATPGISRVEVTDEQVAEAVGRALSARAARDAQAAEANRPPSPWA